MTEVLTIISEKFEEMHREIILSRISSNFHKSHLFIVFEPILEAKETFLHVLRQQKDKFRSHLQTKEASKGEGTSK